MVYPPQGRPIKLVDAEKATFGTGQDSSIVDTGSAMILDFDEQNAGSKTFDIQSDTTSLLLISDSLIMAGVVIDTPDIETATVSARDGSLAQTIADSTGVTTMVSGAVIPAPVMTDIGDLNLADKTRIVISGGAVTMSQSYHSVDGESDTDDALDTLNGGTAGDIVVLRPDDDAATITVTDAGNIILAGDADFVMSDIADLFTAIYDGTNWIELSRSLNHV